MKKRKVLFVIHQLNHGGVQKALISALNAIDYEENEVTLYVRKNRIQFLSEVNDKVEKIIINEDKTHYYRKPCAALLLGCRQICRLFKAKKADEHIQTRLVSYINKSQMEYERKHYFANKSEYDVAVSYIQGYTAKFVADYVKAKKKVMFYHGSTDETHELHEEIMPSFDTIVGVNANVQKVLESLYPKHAHKMTYIENYVDAEEIRTKSQAFHVERDDEKTVLCSCGRLTPVKGFDYAVKAAKILKEKGMSFLWYFVGDGPEREKLEQMIAEYELRNYIQITGMQDNPYPYMNCCDIYVQPSREEAHPLTVIEALILKKPVVTTETVGGRTQIVERKNGFITKINGESIADRIIEMINRKEVYLKICHNLEGIDYKERFVTYQTAWKKVLEEV